MNQHAPLANHIRATTQAMPDNSTTSRFTLLAGSLIAAIVLFAFCPRAQAQPIISAQDSVDAYAMVEQWVRDWDVPNKDQPGVESSPAAVALVTLMLDGKVLGRGTSVSLDPNPLAIWQAARRAVRSADSKLVGDRDAMWDQYIAEISARITITLEISDQLIPISDSEIDLPGFGYTPGVLGVAVGRGDQLQAIGPESMLRRNTDMVQSAMAISNAIASDASTVLRSPRELLAIGYRFYRFEPAVLAQPSPKMGAAFLHRGGRVIPESEISMRSIKSMSTNIATHLMSRAWPGVEHYGLTGEYNPMTGKIASPSAMPFEQAMSAYALLRYGDLGATKHQREAIDFAKSILRDLSIVETKEHTPWDSDQAGAHASAMIVIALSELQLVDILGDEQLNELRINCLETLDGLYTLKSGFNESLPPSSQGLVVFAMARAAKIDPTDRTKLAHNAFAQVMTESSASALVGQMPFLGWAQLQLTSPDSPIEFAPILLQTRELVWAHQLNRDDLDWVDRDLEGGIVFTSSSTPLPSWIAMRPLAFIATMLGDARLTPGTISVGEIPVQIAKQIDAIRFIRQLCAVEETLHAYASPTDANWGVRRSLWDQTQAIEVDAMALLTLTETTRSFKKIMAKATP